MLIKTQVPYIQHSKNFNVDRKKMKEESNPHSELRASARRPSAGDAAGQLRPAAVHTAPASAAC